MIKYGIVGTGGIARIHAELINDIPNIDLFGAHDINDESLNCFCGNYGTEPFRDLHTLLSKIDVAVICSPNFCHMEHIVKSLVYNCDVLCEKPLTTSIAETNLLESFKNSKNIKAINLNYRNLLVVKKIKELIENNQIGEIISLKMSFLKNSALKRKQFTWRDDCSSKLSSGALGDLGIHLLDLSLYLTESNVEFETVKTKMMTKVSKKSDKKVLVDDHSETFYLMDNGTYINIETSKATRKEMCGLYIKITGTNGEIYFSSKKGKEINVDNGENKTIKLEERLYEDPPNEFFGWKDSFYHTHLKLLNAIKKRDNTDITTFEDGLCAQEILEYCIENYKL